jgi:hypothetical protein
MPKKPPPITLNPSFIQPYEAMPRAELEVWRDTVTVFRSDYFTTAQRPLMRAYCHSVVLMFDLEAALADVLGDPDSEKQVEDRIDKAQRRSKMLATALRITLQSHRPPPKQPGKRRGRGRTPVMDEEGQLDWESHFTDDPDDELLN